jgi:hypothetical protein
VNTAPDSDAILTEIKLAIEDAIPYPSKILEADYNAVSDNTWTVFPPGSYTDKGSENQVWPLIAVRQGPHQTFIMYSNGDVGTMQTDWQLVVGK